MRFSKRSFAIVSLICLVGVLEQWTASDGPAFWRYGFGFFLLGLLYEWLLVSRRQTSAQQVGPAALYLGRSEQLKVTLCNPDSRPLQLEYVPGLPRMLGHNPDRRTCEIPARGEQQVAWVVKGTELGPVPWMWLPLRMRGPLGLAWWPRSLGIESPPVVVPDVSGVRQTFEVNAVSGDRATTAGAGVELHHLRDYVPGDPMRAINWKATARTQKLISQVLCEEQHLEVMIVLDIGRTSTVHVDGMTQFSHYVNLAANFARYSLSAGDYVGLVAVADRPLVAMPPSRGPDAVMRINSAMRNLQPQAVETDILAGALEAQRLVRNRSLILFVTDLYSQSTTGEFGRALSLWGKRHLPLVVSLLGEEVAEMLPRRASARAGVYESLAANEYFETVSANASAARRLGAQTVIARPVELQGKVMAQYQGMKAQNLV